MISLYLKNNSIAIRQNNTATHIIECDDRVSALDLYLLLCKKTANKNVLVYSCIIN
jgi:hypothetical protein